MNLLAGWANFYEIVGSSAGALIGLQFVVMTLIVQRSDERVDENTGEAFTTPTIVHFATVLLLSAILCAPWHSAASIAAVWGVMGVAGLLFCLLTTRRAMKQTGYSMVLVDWVSHIALPLVAYSGLIACAAEARFYLREAGFGVAGVALLLLMIGIHNAWDSVTYHVFIKK